MSGDFAALGIPQEAMEEWRSASRPQPVPIMEAAWPALSLFLACDSQWRLAGMEGMPVGLDYAAVGVVARARRVKLTAQLLDDLRVIESAARGELLRRRGR